MTTRKHTRRMAAGIVCGIGFGLSLSAHAFVISFSDAAFTTSPVFSDVETFGLRSTSTRR